MPIMHIATPDRRQRQSRPRHLAICQLRKESLLILIKKPPNELVEVCSAWSNSVKLPDTDAVGLLVHFRLVISVSMVVDGTQENTHKNFEISKLKKTEIGAA